MKIKDLHPTVPSGLYPVVDLDHFPNLSLYATCESLLSAGCPWLQLRGKHLSEDAFLKQAMEIAYLKVHNSFLLMINHSVDIAEQVGADGVHLTAQSASIPEARKRLGKRALIGYSAHSTLEAVEAESQGADYVTLGSIFPTPYKAETHPVHGPEGLWSTVHLLSIPIIAIGGIGKAEIPQLFDPVRGKQVHGFSVIRALFEKEDIEAAAKELVGTWETTSRRA